MTKRHTAILLFTNTLSREVETKIFHSKEYINRRIADNLIIHSATIAKKSGLDYFIIDSDHQVGNTFGERYAQAFEQIFSKGYEKVISIGNDCPNLSEGMLLNAALKLSANDLVIGPAKDGGAYLIGITRTHFQQKNFADLKWQSASVFSNLLSYAVSTSGTVSCLIRLSDVDSSTDLFKAVYLNSNQSFLNQLKQILHLIEESFVDAICAIRSIGSRFTIGLRAPPYL